MKKIVLSLILFLCLPFFAPKIVSAQNNQPSVLPRETVINKDYFASGNSVNLAGTVNGDAFLAGGTVIVEGVVNGDLLVAGGNVDIRGRVTNNVRVVGGQVTVAGDIGRNLSVAGGTVNIVNSARIVGSLAVAGGSVNISAPIGRGATIGAGQITLANTIRGDVTAAGNLTLTPNANITGNLTYWSSTPAQVQPGARVTGRVIQNQPTPEQRVEPNKFLGIFTGSKLIISLIYLISYFIVGLLILNFLPNFTQKVVNNIFYNPWKSLGLGFLVLILTPVIILLLFITVVGIPIALILLATFLITIFLTKIFVALALGQKLFSLSNQKSNNFIVFLVGLIIYILLTLIPIIGGIITFLVTILGLGAILTERKNFFNMLREKKLL